MVGAGSYYKYCAKGVTYESGGGRGGKHITAGIFSMRTLMQIMYACAWFHVFENPPSGYYSEIKAVRVSCG